MQARFSPLRVLTGLAALGLFWMSSGALQAPLASIGAFSTTPSGDQPPRFTRVTVHGPVVWASCDLVPVLVNPGPLGSEGFQLISERLAVVGALAGVRFVPELSGVVPNLDWAVASGLPGIPPVAVAVAYPNQTDLLADGRAGSAAANPLTQADGSQRIVTGAVVLNATRLDEFPLRSGAGMTFANLVDHELGHLVGLDHADSGLMHPVISSGTPAGFSMSERALLASSAPDCPTR